MDIFNLTTKKEKYLVVFSVFIYFISCTYAIYNNSARGYFIFNILNINNIFYFLISSIILFTYIKYDKNILYIIILLIYDTFYIIKEAAQLFFKKVIYLETNSNTVYIFILFFSIIGIFFIYKYSKTHPIFVIVFIFFYSLMQLLQNLYNSNNEKFNCNDNNNVLNRVDHINKNYYIYIFDEYPSLKILKHKFAISSKIDDFLKDNNFKSLDLHTSTAISSENELARILSGNEEKIFGIYDLFDLFEKNRFSSSDKYRFYYHSVLEKKYMKGSFLSNKFFFQYNSIIPRYIVPLIRNTFDFNYSYNYKNIHLSFLGEVRKHLNDSTKKIVLVHFLTPHANPNNIYKDLKDKIAEANMIIKQLVELTIKKDPGAGVIVMSDHGIRSVKLMKDEQKLNLFYFRNIEFYDTTIRKTNNVIALNNIKF